MFHVFLLFSPVSLVKCRYSNLVGGLNTSEKYESQLGWWYSQYMESHKSHVPNHQPVMVIPFHLCRDPPSFFEVNGAATRMVRLLGFRQRSPWNLGCLDPSLGHLRWKYCWLVVLTIFKNMKVNGNDYSIYEMENKNDVWNHQPDWVYNHELITPIIPISWEYNPYIYG